MKHIVLASLILALQNTTAFAEETIAPEEAAEAPAAECLQMASDQLRLICYDRVFGFVAPAPAEVTSGQKWNLIEEKDEFTDADTSFAVLDSLPSSRRGSDAPRSLVVRCDGQGGHDIYIIADGYIGTSRDGIPVRFKFGDNAPVQERWSESTRGTAAFLPSGYRDFRSGLTSREDFVFEMTDFRGSRNSARFEGLSNNDSALEFVLAGCTNQ